MTCLRVPIQLALNNTEFRFISSICDHTGPLNSNQTLNADCSILKHLWFHFSVIYVQNKIIKIKISSHAGKQQFIMRSLEELAKTVSDKSHMLVCHRQNGRKKRREKYPANLCRLTFKQKWKYMTFFSYSCNLSMSQGLQN